MELLKSHKGLILQTWQAVCVLERGKRRVIVHISWSQWCLRPIKFDSHQNLLCTLETCQLCTAHCRHIPVVPTKDFKPFIYAGVFVPICIPSKQYNLWDFLSDKECSPLISPRLMVSIPFFFFFMLHHAHLSKFMVEFAFICTGTRVLSLLFPVVGLDNISPLISHKT